MVFGRKSKRPVQPSSDVGGESDQLIPLTDELPAPELESIESQVESKILEKETDALEDDFKIDDQSEIIPEYSVGKVLRQGPWMHPFPLIVGVSIIGLLASLFAANLQINRLTEELDKTIRYSNGKLFDAFNFAKSIWNVAYETVEVTLKKNKRK